MAAPLVSICIPLYNGEKYISQCLQSVLSQSFSGFEIIIVDDCSSDNSISIIKSFNDNRLRCYCNEKNLGLVNNWNRCLELSEGAWIKFVFQDDLLHPNCIERMLSVASSDAKFIFCDREIIGNETGSYIQKEDDRKSVLTRKYGYDRPGYIEIPSIANIISDLLYTNFIGEPNCVMFRKDIIQTVGKFDSFLLQLCDLEYWLRIACHYDLYYIPEKLCSFRVHGDSTSAKNNLIGNVVIDKIILTYVFLFSSKFEILRKYLSKRGLKRLEDAFKLKIFEVKKKLEEDSASPELRARYKSLKISIPVIFEYETPSFRTRFISVVVNIRRRLRKLFSQ